MQFLIQVHQQSEARISKSETSSKFESDNDPKESVCADNRVFVIGIYSAGGASDLFRASAFEFRISFRLHFQRQSLHSDDLHGLVFGDRRIADRVPILAFDEN